MMIRAKAQCCELYFNDTKPDGTILTLNSQHLTLLKVELEDGIRTMYEWYLGDNK